MNSMEFYQLDAVLKDCMKLDIEVKLKHWANILHTKLEKELDIKNFIKDKLQHIDDY